MPSPRKSTGKPAAKKSTTKSKKPTRSSNCLTVSDWQALDQLDRLVEEERRIREKYNLPLGLRIPRQIATSLQQCVHCKRDIALLIFADFAKDAAGLEAYARMTDELIKKTNLPAYVIAPPSVAADLDSPALLLRVYPEQDKEPGFTTPDAWESLIKKLSDEHCKQG